MATSWVHAVGVDRVGWLLVHSLWQFAIIALAAAAGLRLMRSRRATDRYRTCVAALAAVMAAPAITWPFLPAHSPPREASANHTARATLSSTEPSMSPAFVRAELDSQAPNGPTADVFADPGSASAIVPPPAAPAVGWRATLESAIAPWLGGMVALWCVGVLVFALRPLSSWCVLARLRRVGISAISGPVRAAFERAAGRIGVHRNVRLLQSTLVNVPVVVGYFRPVILLPVCAIGELSVEQVEAILAHELAHVRRHDYLINLLQTLVETVCFYHPAVWWLSSRIRHEREHCCDELAAHCVGSRAVYGRALLALEELRGTAPVLSLRANGGHLLERVRRLAAAETDPQARGAGALAVAALSILLVGGIGIGAASYARDRSSAAAQTATEAADLEPANVSVEKRETTDSSSPKQENKDGDPRANELARRAHAAAAAIDRLPRFCIRAHAGSRTFQVMKEASPDPIKNLFRALDEPIVEEEWWRYEPVLAWDEKHFLDGLDAPRAHGPDRPEAKKPADNPPFTSFHWGMRNLAGYRGQTGDRAPTLVFQANLATMWKDLPITTPKYLVATAHRFWWGENLHHNQNDSGIPPSVAAYRFLDDELFDGETCHVVESPTRQERLWISPKTGLIRGGLHFSYHGPVENQRFQQSASLKEITGRTFGSHQGYIDWYQNEYENLPSEKKWKLMKAWVDTMDLKTARPSKLVRFRDFREIAPGILWPFREDGVLGIPAEDGFKCLRSTYAVDEVRTDVDLTERVKSLQPNEGERVQDQRYAVAVSYDYRADRSEAEIRKLVDVELQKRLEDQKLVDQLKKPFEDMVGKPAPRLPEAGWVGGERPDVKGKPHLVHFWAAWCGPCKNDFPLLKKLADDRAIVIGMHPAGTPADEVTKVIQQFNLRYPTFVEPGADESKNKISGYPAAMYPYCVLVDAQGNVAAHGWLTDNNARLLRQFGELRRAAASAPKASPPDRPSSESKKPQAQSVEVTCVNNQGAPVAGAEVHLFQYSGGKEGRYSHFGQFTSDQQGRVTCPQSLFTDDVGHFDRWIYARVPGRLVGAARSTKWKNREAINTEGKVVLQASRSVEGKVVVPRGYDPQKVTVLVRTLHILTGAGEFDYQSFAREDHFPGLDRALPEIFERQPDAEGRIRFDDVPQKGRLYLVTQGDGLGEAQWRNDNNTFDRPIELPIGEESSVSGRIVLPEGKPAAGMEVLARLSALQVYSSTFRTVTGDNGDFSIRGLPQTEFVLYVQDPKQRWTFRPRENLSIAPGQPQKMALTMETGVLVTGRVLDPEGKPVEAAGISAVANDKADSDAGLAGESTDANGRYRFRLPVGAARLYFNSVPDGFAYPDPQVVKTLDIKPGQADIENLDFTISRPADGEPSSGPSSP